MKKELKKPKAASVFKYIAGIEYFNFEEDFIEKNIRCIPMIVRFKMDKSGIKLKLAEWNKFSVEDRIKLATMPCCDVEETETYNNFLVGLIVKNTGKEATDLAMDQNPAWANSDKVPEMLQEKLKEYSWNISLDQWKGLTSLQRFALLKLYKPGHENKNFQKAMKEFNLI